MIAEINKLPEISIIIPTLNRREYLEELLECLMLQKTEEVEILVSSNASIDGTDEMIAEKKYDIRYFRQEENIGGVLNIIYLLKHVTGRYVFILADSELLVQDGIEYVLNIIKKSPEVGVIVTECSKFEIDKDGKRNVTPCVYNYYKEDMLFNRGGEALELVFKMTSNVSGILIRTDLLDLKGFEHHFNSRYPQLYLAGKSVLQADAYHISYPIVLLREGIVKYWKHQEAFRGQKGFTVRDKDFNCKSILDIAKDLTSGLENCLEVYRRIVKYRVRNVYSALFAAKKESLRSFLRTTKALACIPEYCSRWEFWLLVFVVGILGEKVSLGIVRMIKKRLHLCQSIIK